MLFVLPDQCRVHWSSLLVASLVLMPSSSSLLAASLQGERETPPRPEMILLTVDKESLRADLRTLPDPGQPSEILQSFRIAIGKEAGDKEREGDNRTPEGIYFSLTHINTAEFLPGKYGPRSIPLNFPNPMDQWAGKTGYGIWLHGAGNDDRIANAQVTEGCVAFYNADIVRLKSWLQPDQGIVVIAADSSQVNQSEETTAVHASTQAWVRAWQTRQVGDYISHYDRDFKLSGRGLNSYRDYKGRVFRSYKEMSVGISGLRVITHPKYAVSIMNQDFHGDRRFASIGRKILYWVKRPEGWRIVREFFDRKRFGPVSFSASDLAALKAGPLPQTARLD